jgi:hypothetical protein
MLALCGAASLAACAALRVVGVAWQAGGVGVKIVANSGEESGVYKYRKKNNNGEMKIWQKAAGHRHRKHRRNGEKRNGGVAENIEESEKSSA